MQDFKVEYNVMARVARKTTAKPLEVYSFIRDEGVEFIHPLHQSIPAKITRPDTVKTRIGTLCFKAAPLTPQLCLANNQIDGHRFVLEGNIGNIFCPDA